MTFSLRSWKRRFARAPIRTTATCTLAASRVQGTLWQISEGGCFVELPGVDALPPVLAVGFELPGHGVHRVVARPVWKADKAPRSVPRAGRGVGCEFRDLSPQTRQAIAEYVKKSKQTYSSLQLALALNRPTPALGGLLRETGLAEVQDRRTLVDLVATCVSQLQTAT